MATLTQPQTGPGTRPAARPWTLWVVVGLLVFIAIGAVAAGFSMIVDPTGAGLGMTTDWLESPFFADYLIPGLFLFLVNGLGSLFAAAALIWRPGWAWAERLNPYRRQRWPWTLAVALGLVYMVWITIQVLSIPSMFSFLQPTVFLIGMAIVVLMIEPRMRRAFAA